VNAQQPMDDQQSTRRGQSAAPPRIRSGAARRFALLCPGVVMSFMMFSAVRVLGANPPPSTEPVSLLQQLSDDTQRVYSKVRIGIVRVRLPTPQWLEEINEQEKLLRKWGTQLSPEVRDQLLREQQNARTEEYRRVGVVPATQPMTTQATAAPAAPPTTQPGEVQFPKHTDEIPDRVLVAIGLLLDADGHVVVPLFVEKEAVGNTSLRVLMGDGRLTNAKFIGSDRKTNLTVFQLDDHSGTPVKLARTRPDDGQLTVVVAPEGGARLVVWTNLHPEPGLIVDPDGSIAGFGINGQFLGAASCKPIVDQIIATGEVHRAVLGVKVREIRKDDVLRQQTPALGVRPAIRVEEIDANSAAANGGLQVGDLILAVAGEPVGDGPTFAAVIATRSGKTKLQVLRGSESLNLTVELLPK
jgi:PDZ domain